MLEISNYKKYYGKKLILSIPEFQLQSGIYWLQGVNGSGKSTFLKSIAGIISFEGKILCDDLDVRKDIAAYRNIVNFADAEPVYPEFLTGRELIGMYEEAKRAPIGQSKERIDELQMENYLDSAVGTYSSGMLKKLSLLLAFIGTPKLILLDEPLITIDAATLEIIYGWIKKMYTSQNVSFVLSSHQPIDNSMLPELRRILIQDQKLYSC